MARVTCDQLEDAILNSLTAAGATPADARLTTSALVYAEGSGLKSHGLLRLGPLLEQLRSGKINRRPQRSARQAGETVWLIDGDYGMGFPAAQEAVNATIRTLKTSPVVIASVSKSHQLGAAGYYAEQIALDGYVGFVTSTTFGAIAPIGGRTPILGNPPLALAVPRTGQHPIVVDMAPAVVARGNIAAAARRGDKIPATWALDEEGVPTDDPHAAMRGTLNAIGGQKGVLLAMLVDLLLITLTNANLPRETSSVFTPDGPPPNLGHLVLGFDPVRFDVTDAADRCARYVASMLSDSDEMHAPGTRRRKLRAEAKANGLVVDDSMWAEVEPFLTK